MLSTVRNWSRGTVRRWTPAHSHLSA